MALRVQSVVERLPPKSQQNLFPMLIQQSMEREKVVSSRNPGLWVGPALLMVCLVATLEIPLFPRHGNSSFVSFLTDETK